MKGKLAALAIVALALVALPSYALYSTAHQAATRNGTVSVDTPHPISYSTDSGSTNLGATNSGPPNAGSTSSSSATPGPGDPGPANSLPATIMGAVIIGPDCPVQLAERPCLTPDYLSRTLVLTSPDGTEIRIQLASDGAYEASLPAGTYTITLEPCAELGCSSVFPQTVALEPGTVTTLNLPINTGIR